MSGAELASWEQRVLALDRTNMEAILVASGTPFPLDKRLLNYRHPSTVLVVASKGTELQGYVEFRRSDTTPDAIFLSSLQVQAGCRRSCVFPALAVALVHLLRQMEFTELESNVQAANPEAVRLYKRLGFAITARKDSASSLDVRGDRHLLDSPTIERLRNRYLSKVVTLDGPS